MLTIKGLHVVLTVRDIPLKLCMNASPVLHLIALMKGASFKTVSFKSNEVINTRNNKN